MIAFTVSFFFLVIKKVIYMIYCVKPLIQAIQTKFKSDIQVTQTCPGAKSFILCPDFSPSLKTNDSMTEMLFTVLCFYFFFFKHTDLFFFPRRRIIWISWAFIIILLLLLLF